MRNVTLLNAVDASQITISEPLNLEKRTDWELIITSDSLDDVPELFIEKGYNAGKCNPLPTEWFILPNKCDNTGTFLIDDSIIQIEKSGFTANWFRVRIDPKLNTTGTITVKIHYKDYP
jgi:hypothetical protein